jgi:hypothetical protein
VQFKIRGRFARSQNGRFHIPPRKFHLCR